MVTPPTLDSLASDGGAPAPTASCGSDFRIARLGRWGPSPYRVLRLGFPVCSPRTVGPQPHDVLRLGFPDCSPRTVGPQPLPRPAARISGSLASDGGAPAPTASCGSDFRIARLGRWGPSPYRVLRLGFPDCSPRTVGPQPLPRPAARISGLLASDGGAPAPTASCGSDFRIARLGRWGPSPYRILRLGLPDCSPRTVGPQPHDVLRLGLPDCSPRTVGPLE